MNLDEIHIDLLKTCLEKHNRIAKPKLTMDTTEEQFSKLDHFSDLIDLGYLVLADGCVLNNSFGIQTTIGSPDMYRVPATKKDEANRLTGLDTSPMCYVAS